MKETAVEFLLKELINNFEEEMQNIYLKNMHLVANICEQAKEMEKQQLEKVFKDAFIYGLDWNQKEISFDEYYNEQFKKK